MSLWPVYNGDRHMGLTLLPVPCGPRGIRRKQFLCFLEFRNWNAAQSLCGTAGNTRASLFVPPPTLAITNSPGGIWPLMFMILLSLERSQHSFMSFDSFARNLAGYHLMGPRISTRCILLNCQHKQLFEKNVDVTRFLSVNPSLG